MPLVRQVRSRCYTAEKFKNPDSRRTRITMSSRTIVLASRNKKKTKEVSEILARVGFRVLPVIDFPNVGEVEEDGQTFAENAAKKASQVARELNQWVIGEDSGLMVDALNGAPGIYSARYSGDGATDERNNAKLIADLSDIADDSIRFARHDWQTCTNRQRLKLEGRVVRSNTVGYRAESRPKRRSSQLVKGQRRTRRRGAEDSHAHGDA